ncbi:MAG: hypothetical protein QM766_06230 [Burkholderiaceae bacterium]
MNWTFGVALLLIGLLFAVSIPLAGLSLVAISALLLPPVRNWVHSKTGKELAVKPRAVGIITLFIAFGVFVLQDEQRRAEQIASKEAKERIAQAETAQKKLVEYFNSNGPQILTEVRTALDNGAYQDAIEKSSKYLAVNNAELSDLSALAKQRLAEAQKADQTARLLMEIKTISASDNERHLVAYQRLASLSPENQEYRSKVKLYADRLAEAQRAEQAAKVLAEQTKTVTEIERRLKDNTERLKKYYASADQVKQASTDIIRLALIKGTYADSKESDQKALGRRAARLLLQVEQQARMLYASSLEEVFVKSGMDAQVSATGKDKRRLRISYALMSQPLFYKFQNEIKIGRQAAPLGFTQIVHTNGFESSLGKTWTVDL